MTKLQTLFSFTAISSFLLVTIVPGTAWARYQQKPEAQHPAETEVQLAKEVRHRLVMLPFYSVFDNLEFKVNGEEVTLMGQVVRPTLKSDAESTVKSIEGVTSVKNEIHVLPPSSTDNRIRLAQFRAIYSAAGMQKYAIQAVPPIHIIVDNGRVTLAGVVDSQMDKTTAAMRAKQVPGVFSVTDNLRIQK